MVTRATKRKAYVYNLMGFYTTSIKGYSCFPAQLYQRPKRKVRSVLWLRSGIVLAIWCKGCHLRRSQSRGNLKSSRKIMIFMFTKGIVEDIDDPAKAGRVLCSMAELEGDTHPEWIHPISIFAALCRMLATLLLRFRSRRRRWHDRSFQKRCTILVSLERKKTPSPTSF